MFTNLLAMQEPHVMLLRRWLQLMNVNVSHSSISETLQNHPDYPSLLSISDALRTWKINNVAANIPKEQLSQLPLPFIAHTYAGGVKILRW